MNFVPIIIVLQNKITGPIPEFEPDRKLEPELDSCSHPIPELELDHSFIKKPRI